MNRPGVLTRLAGWPPLTVTIFGVCAVALTAWHQGDVPWWFALLAAVVAARTAEAFFKRRKYKAWAAQWDAMAGEKESKARPAREKKKFSGQAYAITAALGAFFVLPNFFPRPEGLGDISRPEVAVWLLCGLYPVFVLVLAIIRRIRSKETQTTKDNAAPVSWMLSRTVDSPSRQMAVRNLPEYAARILKQ